MALIASSISYLFEFCDRAVAGGYVVSMVIICAVQYLYHTHRNQRAAELKERLCRQIDDVQKDLRIVSRDRTLTALENQLLREFTGELDLDRTLEQLIRRLVSEAKDGFAAYVALNPPPGRVTHSRGICEKSREAMVVDLPLLERVSKDGVISLRKSEMFSSALCDSLSPDERAKFSQLYLAGIGDPENLAGVIVTTSLFPAGAPQDQQIELARRLMRSLSGIVKRNQELDVRDRQLQSINEIMELRAVTDRKHTSPLDMVDAFVDRLRTMIGAERAVLFLVNSEGRGNYKPLCRCGEPLPTGIAKKYADFELGLAEMAIALKEPEVLDPAQLARLGIPAMIGSAVVSPVASPNGIAGALCLTRGSKEPFCSAKPELISWAARYLSETLLRALHQAVAEWHARQDPLTDLSNRRTFDREFSNALQAASGKGHPCALLMVDIDRFKSVNDTYGHLIGDEVLRSVSRVLKESASRLSTGAAGLAARFGGEEFAILLPNIPCEEATWIGETIRATVEVTPIHVPQAQINVTVSVGVAVFPVHGRTAEELIGLADAALYEAKEAGRNRVVSAASMAT